MAPSREKSPSGRGGIKVSMILPDQMAPSRERSPEQEQEQEQEQGQEEQEQEHPLEKSYFPGEGGGSTCL
eukprot:2844671-Karenia_brevis.AAC.1